MTTKKNRLLLWAYALLLLAGPIFAQETQKSPQAIRWQDVPSWKSISTNSVQVSDNGVWMAYAMMPVEGDGELIVQRVADNNVKKTYPIGSTSFPNLAFSEDGRWLAFKEYPKDKDRKAAAKSGGKGLKDKLILLDLANDFKKTEFENVGNFSFNGKSSSLLAINLVREGSNGDAKGSDLLLVHLTSLKKQNIGNVYEFSFNKSGDFLAYTIDAANQLGNGLYLLQTATGKTELLDTDAATYRSISWTENGDAFAALKMVKDKAFKQDHGKVLGVRNLSRPQLSLYDPKADSLAFPKNMTISPNRRPSWSEDLTRIFFGLHALVPEKKEEKKAEPKSESTEHESLEKIKADTSIKSIADLQKAIAKLEASKPKTEAKNDATKPDMTIWHWQDKRLQSRQQILENQDKNYNTLAMFDIRTGKFRSLQDSTLKELNILPKQKFALGSDDQDYELDINLDGQNFRDFYAVNLETGEKKMLFKKFYLPSFASFPRSSPDGTKLLYAMDGHFHTMDLGTGKSQNLTANLTVSFVNVEDDHNVDRPMHNAIGWSSDSRYVLLNDGWDIWQVPLESKEKAINLTVNGKKDKIRHQYRFSLDPEEKGIDLKKPQYFRTYGEWNKKSGIVRLEAGKSGLLAGPKTLAWDDANISRLSKAKNASVYMFTKEKFNQPTEFFLTDANLSYAKQVTENAPDAGKYAWSSGVRLVNYVSDKGDSLQAALFLPAGYEEGKKYPTIVYYYEKLSQTLHNYSNPGFSGTGWNPSVYTSNGYAVLVPDIVYTLDDPGMSAVWCVLPAVKEALKTGVLDESKMGLHGHSWGGYQTAFLITQTNMFKAAAAGAPLTNMVSMYDLIYWNTGGGNMSIFEASQGRFKGGPWENWDSYLRNSPVYHVKNVNTPLLMLHNDKDGAVDFTQGIEYYNALRRLKKPVIMLQYKGENHGLSKMESRKDYSVRMMEFFDFHLKGEKPADWISSGVDKLKLDLHLEERAF